MKKSISFSDFVGDALYRRSSLFLLSAKFKGTDLRGRISRLAGFLRRKEVDTGGILPYAVFRKYTRQRRNCEVKKLGFGLMRLPLVNAEDQKSIDMDMLREMVDLFFIRRLYLF